MKKLTQDELKQLTELQNGYSKIYFEIGQLEIEKRLLEEKIQSLKTSQEYLFSDIKKIQENEVLLATDLNNKYGRGTIDINTGEIIPIS